MKKDQNYFPKSIFDTAIATKSAWFSSRYPGKRQKADSNRIRSDLGLFAFDCLNAVDYIKVSLFDNLV